MTSSFVLSLISSFSHSTLLNTYYVPVTMLDVEEAKSRPERTLKLQREANMEIDSNDTA